MKTTSFHLKLTKEEENVLWQLFKEGALPNPPIMSPKKRDAIQKLYLEVMASRQRH